MTKTMTSFSLIWYSALTCWHTAADISTSGFHGYTDISGCPSMTHLLVDTFFELVWSQTLFLRGRRNVSAHPECIRLMDDDIVLLIGLMYTVNSLIKDSGLRSGVHQLPLSLYLMTRCQMKLHQSLSCRHWLRRPTTLKSWASVLKYM